MSVAFPNKRFNITVPKTIKEVVIPTASYSLFNNKNIIIGQIIVDIILSAPSKIYIKKYFLYFSSNNFEKDSKYLN